MLPEGGDGDGDGDDVQEAATEWLPSRNTAHSDGTCFFSSPIGLALPSDAQRRKRPDAISLEKKKRARQPFASESSLLRQEIRPRVLPIAGYAHSTRAVDFQEPTRKRERER